MPDDDNSILEYVPGGTKLLRGPLLFMQTWNAYFKK